MPEIRTVLCPVDLTQLSPVAVSTATELCQRFGAKLVLHHNLGQRPPDFLSNRWMWSEECEGEERKKADRESEMLERLLSEVPEEVSREGRITRGPIEESVLFLAGELPADLLVMGSHGPSSSEHRSLTEKIIIRSPCPTLTIGELHFRKELFTEPGRPRALAAPILVPVDFSKRSADAVAQGAALAAELESDLVLMHVVGRRAGERRRQQAAARLAELVPDGVASETRLVEGEPAQEILNVARDVEASLVVMPAHGKGLLKRFLFGATTFEILHGAECPVWFVPGEASRVEAGAAAAAAVIGTF